jgi:hypothetical protein
MTASEYKKISGSSASGTLRNAKVEVMDESKIVTTVCSSWSHVKTLATAEGLRWAFGWLWAERGRYTIDQQPTTAQQSIWHSMAQSINSAQQPLAWVICSQLQLNRQPTTAQQATYYIRWLHQLNSLADIPMLSSQQPSVVVHQSTVVYQPSNDSVARQQVSSFAAVHHHQPLLISFRMTQSSAISQFNSRRKESSR